MTVRSILIMAAIGLGAAVSFAAQTGTFRLHAEGVDAPVVSRLRADLVWGEGRVEDALGEFPDTVSVRVHPDRDAFDAALRAEWGMPETGCWVVGAADRATLHLLSPAAWENQACEHDADDAGHVRRLIAHEATHAYHGQVNPSGDLGGLEEIGWFVEGLATYVSGQLEARHAGRAAEVLARGEGPDRLDRVWDGPDRYGVAGSLVAYIDQAWGRATLRRLLTATSQEQILDELGTTECGLLAAWEEWVAAG